MFVKFVIPCCFILQGVFFLYISENCVREVKHNTNFLKALVPSKVWLLVSVLFLLQLEVNINYVCSFIVLSIDVDIMSVYSIYEMCVGNVGIADLQ